MLENYQKKLRNSFVSFHLQKYFKIHKMAHIRNCVNTSKSKGKNNKNKKLKDIHKTYFR